MTFGGATKIRVLVVVVAGAILALVAGCGAQDPDQARVLEEQQQQNEELQQELDARDKEQEEAERQEEAEKQEELEQQVSELEKKLEENEQQNESEEPNGSGSNSESPDVVIESNGNWTAPPSQAPQGVVVVSPNYNVQGVDAEEAQVLDGAIAYYQAAEVGDYVTTYELLSSGDQSYYTVDEWVTANTNLDSAAAEFVVTDAYPEDVGNGSRTYAVTLTAYLPDGSTFDRKTYFTNEGNGYWAHYLTQEEVDMFNGAL